MQAYAHLGLAAIAGIAAAALLLRGLRLTLLRMPYTSYPVVLVLVSMLVRLALAVALFVLVMRHLGMPALIICVVCFALTRWVLIYAHTRFNQSGQG